MSELTPIPVNFEEVGATFDDLRAAAIRLRANMDDGQDYPIEVLHEALAGMIETVLERILTEPAWYAFAEGSPLRFEFQLALERARRFVDGAPEGSLFAAPRRFAGRVVPSRSPEWPGVAIALLVDGRPSELFLARVAPEEVPAGGLPVGARVHYTPQTRLVKPAWDPSGRRYPQSFATQIELACLPCERLGCTEERLPDDIFCQAHRAIENAIDASADEAAQFCADPPLPSTCELCGDDLVADSHALGYCPNREE